MSDAFSQRFSLALKALSMTRTFLEVIKLLIVLLFAYLTVNQVNGTGPSPLVCSRRPKRRLRGPGATDPRYPAGLSSKLRPSITTREPSGALTSSCEQRASGIVCTSHRHFSSIPRFSGSVAIAITSAPIQLA